jgi:ankyrin repeat protein
MTFKKLMLLLALTTPCHLPALASSASASAASTSAMDIDGRAEERAADQKRAYAVSTQQRPDLFAILDRHHIHNKFCCGLLPPDVWHSKYTFPNNVQPGQCIFYHLDSFLDEPCPFLAPNFALKISAEGLCQEFKVALQNGADPNQRNAAGTPILSAISQVLIPELKELLIKSGADINLPDNKGNTPLFYMLTLDLYDDPYNRSMHDFSSVAKSLRDQGMIVFNPDAYELRPAALLFLIASGANIHHKNKSGSTIFKHLMTNDTISSNSAEDLEFLINHGAEFPIDDTHEELLKKALLMACERSFVEDDSGRADFGIITMLTSYGLGRTHASVEEDAQRLTKKLFDAVPGCFCHAGECDQDRGLCDRYGIQEDILKAASEGLTLYQQRLAIQHKILDRAVTQLGLNNKLTPASSEGAPSVVGIINEYAGVFLPLEKEGSHEDNSWQDLLKDDHVHAMEAQMEIQTAASSAASSSASATSQATSAAGVAAMQVDEDPNDDVRGLPKRTKRKAPESSAQSFAAGSSASASASAMDVDEGKMKSSASASASAASSAASSANAAEEADNEGPASKKLRTE